MSKNESHETDDEGLNSKNILWVLMCIGAAAVAAGVLVTFTYFRYFSGPITSDHEAWGTFGDFFGGTLNPIFSFMALIALLFTIVLQSRELKLTRDELRLSRQAQQESKESIVVQAKIMKDSATLSALGNIYNHYGESYGSGDGSNMLKSVASGHRSWAIRESFSIIDETFEDNRKKLVSDEFCELTLLLNKPIDEFDYSNRIGKLVGSLIVDRRLSPDQRKQLWPLYEHIRDEKSEYWFDRLNDIASKIINT